EAGLALADAGAEAGVPLDALDVPGALLDRVTGVVERHVLTGAEKGLAHGWIFLPAASISTKVASRRAPGPGRFAGCRRQVMAYRLVRSSVAKNSLARRLRASAFTRSSGGAARLGGS